MDEIVVKPGNTGRGGSGGTGIEAGRGAWGTELVVITEADTVELAGAC